MKKLFIFSITMILSMAFFGVTANAAEPSYQNEDNSFVIKASPCIDYYNATIVADDNGIIALDCIVRGTGIMDTIGMKSIQIEKYVSGSWTNVKTWSDLYQYNSIQANTYSTYQGAIGSQYRAVVIFYAKNQSGSDTRTVTTKSVTAER